MSGQKVSATWLGIFLCLICAASTAVMAAMAVFTQEPIKAANQKKISDGLKVVLPAFDNDPVSTMKSFKSSDGVDVDFFSGLKDGRLAGVAAKTTTSIGYGGRIEGLIGFDTEGRIRTFIITACNETPGLGTAITDRRRQRTLADVLSGKPVAAGLPPNKYLDQFAGHSADGSSWKSPWKVAKDGGDVDAKTGATVSSRAVTDLAWRAASTLSAHKSEILQAAKP